MASRNRAKHWTVDRCTIDAFGQGKLISTGTDRKHAAGWQFLHQTSAGGEKLKGVFQLEGSSQHGGDVFANAVTDEEGWPDAPGHPELRQCILDNKDARLGDRSAVDVMRCGFPFMLGWIERGPHVVADEGHQQCRAFIDCGAEDGFGIVDFATHFKVLRTLAGKQECDSWCVGWSCKFFAFCAEFCGSFREVSGHDGSAVRKCPSTVEKCVGDVC